jgi:hypothetical protein
LMAVPQWVVGPTPTKQIAAGRAPFFFNSRSTGSGMRYAQATTLAKNAATGQTTEPKLHRHTDTKEEQ